MKILIIYLLLFLTVKANASTFTVVTPDLLPPTTYSIFYDTIKDLSSSEKIIEINKELAKKPDTITGQPLVSLRFSLLYEEWKKLRGRRYTPYKQYPVYEKK